VTPPLKQELWSTLANLAAMPAPHRTITTLLEVIQNESLRQALRSYALVGPYGNLLDADHDSLGDASWQAFEMEGLMRSPALSPVLTNVFHRIEQRFGATFRDDVTRKELSRPTLLILDEAWLFLGHSTFAAKIREWLKTLRKKNVAVVFATQSLTDVASSTISASVMESCPTRIFLPDSRAEEPSFRDLYQSFGLNDQQITILQRAIPKRDYYYQSPAGNRLFQLGLGDVGLAFSRGGSPEVQVAVPRILAENGADRFATAYLREFAPNAPGISEGAKHE
jgi:type IV secretion system protein VirB4